MTHAHFSKYPISDLSHPKVAWCPAEGTRRRSRVIYTNTFERKGTTLLNYGFE